VNLFTAHVNGTCRLGTDPRIAGTDPHGERFGAPGVFVGDGSLLPTAPGVNPQETIMALATVVAERVAARWRSR
jgi:long-chain-alcohol oxidase